MIYELALSVKTGLNDEEITKFQETVRSVVQAHEGDVLIEDDWGRLALAQVTRKGLDSIRMLYFIYRANNKNNIELVRRLKIMENTVRYLIVALGDDAKADDIIKSLKIPFSKKYPGSVIDDDDYQHEEYDDGGDDRDRRSFSRRRSCYFTIKGIKADWKDPNTYAPLLNEFGKISLSRISSVSRKHQRFVTTAIKRARNIGIVGHLSNHTARPV